MWSFYFNWEITTFKQRTETMLVKTYGAAVVGVNAHEIIMEVAVGGRANWNMIGLPDKVAFSIFQEIANHLLHF